MITKTPWIRCHFLIRHYWSFHLLSVLLRHGNSSKNVKLVLNILAWSNGSRKFFVTITRPSNKSFISRSPPISILWLRIVLTKVYIFLCVNNENLPDFTFWVSTLSESLLGPLRGFNKLVVLVEVHERKVLRRNPVTPGHSLLHIFRETKYVGNKNFYVSIFYLKGEESGRIFVKRRSTDLVWIKVAQFLTIFVGSFRSKSEFIFYSLIIFTILFIIKRL